MPKILTDAYRDATFYVPYSEDRTEGCYIKPLTETAMGKMRDEAAKEGGADDKLSSARGGPLVRTGNSGSLACLFPN